VVLDASVAAAWLLPDEASDASRRVYVRTRRGSLVLHAPELWLWAVRQHHRLGGEAAPPDAEDALLTWSVLDAIRTAVELSAPAPAQVRAALVLALDHGVSLYDAGVPVARRLAASAAPDARRDPRAGGEGGSGRGRRHGGARVSAPVVATAAPARAAAMRFIMVTVLIDMVSIGLMVPVLPALVGSFTQSQTEQAWWYGAVTFAFSFANFLTSPLLGALSDRYGRRPCCCSASSPSRSASSSPRWRPRSGC
jgi:predicted nucleic acid-binding protein